MDGPVSQVSVDGLTLGPAARQQPHAAAARGRRRAEPPRAGDRPVRGVELRRRRPGDLAPGGGRRPGRGAALSRLTARPTALLRGACGRRPRPVDNSAVPAVVGRVPSSRSGTLAACPPPRTPLRRCRPAFCSPPCSTCSCPAPAAAAPRPGRGGAPAAPPGSARSGGRCCPVGPPVVAAGRYRGPLRTAVLAYKERGRRDLAGPLAALLVPALAPGRGLGAGVARARAVPAGRSARPRRRPRAPAVPAPGPRRRRAAGRRRRCGSVGGRATRSGWTPRRASRTWPGGSASTPGRCRRRARR